MVLVFFFLSFFTSNMCSRQFAPSMEDKMMSNSHQIKPVTLRPKTQAF